MFFKKKSEKEKARCENCESRIIEDFIFCPYCGESLMSPEEEMREFGMLGRNDILPEEFMAPMPAQGGITERLFASLVNSLMKNLDQQMRDVAEKSEVTTYPNGIRIKIGMPVQGQKTQKPAEQSPLKAVTDEQLKKMSGLPRTEAKMKMRRLGNKLVYELNAPGIASTDDVLLAKLESGYEIKAIGEKKVYVNSIPVNLPLQSFSLQDNKLIVEFKTGR